MNLLFVLAGSSLLVMMDGLCLCLHVACLIIFKDPRQHFIILLCVLCVKTMSPCALCVSGSLNIWTNFFFPHFWQNLTCYDAAEYFFNPFLVCVFRLIICWPLTDRAVMNYITKFNKISTCVLWHFVEQSLSEALRPSALKFKIIHMEGKWQALDDLRVYQKQL